MPIGIQPSIGLAAVRGAGAVRVPDAPIGSSVFGRVPERVRRIVRLGGVLRLSDVVYNVGPREAEECIEAWRATGGSEVEGKWIRAARGEHVRDEYSTFTWLLEPMIERSGFEIENASYSPDGFWAKYVARAM